MKVCTRFVFKMVQKTRLKKFSKDEYIIKSIYEVGTNETYQIIAKNANGKNVTIELSKSCFGGCG